MLCIYNRDSTDLILSHQSQCFTDRSIGTECNGIEYQPVLTAFYFSYLVCLLINGHILMENAQASFACQCYSELCFCNSVHGSTQHGYL